MGVTTMATKNNPPQAVMDDLDWMRSQIILFLSTQGQIVQRLCRVERRVLLTKRKRPTRRSKSNIKR